MESGGSPLNRRNCALNDIERRIVKIGGPVLGPFFLKSVIGAHARPFFCANRRGAARDWGRAPRKDLGVELGARARRATGGPHRRAGAHAPAGPAGDFGANR